MPFAIVDGGDFPPFLFYKNLFEILVMSLDNHLTLRIVWNSGGMGYIPSLEEFF